MIKEIAFLFLKLGFIAFGGPAAHIAMMEEEVVTKRKWMDRQHFLDLVGATNLIPGPNSTEMAIHCGYHRGGILGLLTAGVSFILPAVAITCGFAWLYVGYGSIPAIEPFFFGIKPAVLAVILAAVFRLGKKAYKGWKLGVIGIGVLAASLAGISEIFSILAGGILGMFWLYLGEKKDPNKAFSLVCPLWLSSLWEKSKTITMGSIIQPASQAALGASLFPLFLVFLKVGSILFGSGYVLIAYLDAELVTRLGWLTRQELLDAIAIGQFTPGPVLSTSTFIGYQIHGIAGAVAATLGIFIPSFVFVLILNPIVPKLRKSRITACFLDAVNISAVAIMISILVKMGREIILDWKAILIFLLSTVMLLFIKKLGAGWVIVGGAAVGYILSFIKI